MTYSCWSQPNRRNSAFASCDAAKFSADGSSSSRSNAADNASPASSQSFAESGVHPTARTIATAASHLTPRSVGR